MDYKEKVEFTPEGFQKAIKSLDFLPEDVAKKLAAGFCFVIKMV